MELHVFDVSANQVVRLSPKDFDQKLMNIKEQIEKVLMYLSAFGNFKLDTFKASLAFEAGIWIFKINGGIELSYKRD